MSRRLRNFRSVAYFSVSARTTSSDGACFPRGRDLRGIFVVLSDRTELEIENEGSEVLELKIDQWGGE